MPTVLPSGLPEWPRGRVSRGHRDRWWSATSVTWLIGALLLGLVVWAGYALSQGDFLNGRCGGILSNQHLSRGVPEGAANVTSAVIGAVLWVIAGVGATLAPHRRGLLLAGYVAAYIAALIVFAEVVAPAVWGPTDCVPDS